VRDGVPGYYGNSTGILVCARQGAAENESPHLYIGPSWMTSTVLVIAAGNSIPGLDSRAYLFVPRTSGLVNRRFREISDDLVYCYETPYFNYSDATTSTNPVPGFTILVRLTGSARTVLMEKRKCSNVRTRAVAAHLAGGDLRPLWPHQDNADCPGERCQLPGWDRRPR